MKVRPGSLERKRKTARALRALVRMFLRGCAAKEVRGARCRP